MRTRHRGELGRAGEDLAAAHLEARGLDILERNWRDGRRGEIDIVAWDPGAGTVVVCEVKTRIGTRFGTALEAVGPDKLARLRRLARAWLATHDVHGRVRFDVVAVTLPFHPGDEDNAVAAGWASARLEWVQGVVP